MPRETLCPCPLSLKHTVMLDTHQVSPDSTVDAHMEKQQRAAGQASTVCPQSPGSKSLASTKPP